MLYLEHNPYRRNTDGSHAAVHLSAADFAFSLSKATEAAVQEQRAWNIMVVMAGDCNLAEALFDNLLDLKKHVNKQVHLCIFFDGPYLADTFFFHLNQDTSLHEDIVQRFLELDMTRPQYLTEILHANRLLFPADHHLLILSGHGLGHCGMLTDESNWKPGLFSGDFSYPPDFDNLVKKLEQCGVDAKNKLNKLRIRRLSHGAAAFADGSENKQKKPCDILALDACAMGSIEVMSYWSDQAERMIASELPEPAAGYPYGEILDLIRCHPEICPDDLAAQMTKMIGHHMKKAAPRMHQAITQIALNQTHTETFNDRLKALLMSYIGAFSSRKVSQRLLDAMLGMDRFNGGYVDVFLLLEQWMRFLPKQQANEAFELLSWLRNSGPVIEVSAPENPYLPKGLSIYFPLPEAFDIRYLEFVQHTSVTYFYWCAFMALCYIGLLKDQAYSHPLVQTIVNHFQAVSRMAAQPLPS